MSNPNYVLSLVGIVFIVLVSVVLLCWFCFTVYGFVTNSPRCNRQTKKYKKNAFCNAMYCDFLGSYGCYADDCKFTAKDLTRYLNRDGIIILIGEEE